MTKRTVFERQKLKNTVNNGDNDGDSKQIGICVKESLLQWQTQTMSIYAHATRMQWMWTQV